MPGVLALAMVGCGGGPILELDGPREVRVDRLGPVEAPSAALSEGGAPSGVVWSVEPPEVARVDGESVIATAEGDAVITGSWQGQSVSWSLEVRPSYELLFVGAPAQIGIGEAVPLQVAARRGGEDARPGALAWSSSDPLVLTVDGEGVARGVSAGVAFVTVDGHGSTAMAEIRVQ